MTKICIIGDIMVDETWYGHCKRLSPEAPVPVCNTAYATEQLGGAGNVARNLKAIAPDCEVYLAGWLGKEHEGLLYDKYPLSFFPNGWTIQTNIKLRIVDISSHYHLVRVDNENPGALFLQPLPTVAVMEWLTELDPDGIILSDYVKGVVSDNLVTAILNSPLSASVFVDSRQKDFKIFNGVNFITPNMKEFKQLCETLGCSQPDEVIQRLNLQGILLTRSHEGMDLYLRGGQFWHVDPSNKQIIDVTGAGDTALATFAYLMTTSNVPPWVALKLANEMAGDVCMISGTAVPSKTLMELDWLNGNHQNKETK